MVCRKALVQKLAPLLNHMEGEKRRECAENEQATGVSCQDNGCTLIYKDIETGDAISAEEYGERYLKYIEHKKIAAVVGGSVVRCGSGEVLVLGAQMIHKLKNQDKNNAAPEPKEEKSALEVRIELKHETKAEAQIVECSICLEALPIDGSNAKRLNCSHLFHGALLLLPLHRIIPVCHLSLTLVV